MVDSILSSHEDIVNAKKELEETQKRIEESMMEGVPKDRETALLDLTFSARSCLVDLVRRMATSFANRWESDY